MDDRAASKNRNDKIDSVKYWLMVLVIICHVFSQHQFSSTPWCKVVWEWTLMFIMPLFVFISGYFSRKKDYKHFRASCWKIIEPLVISQAFIRIYEFFSLGTLSLKSIITPWWVLWYLLSLLYWRVLIQIIPDKILNNTKLIILSTFAISLFAGFLPFNRLLSLQRTLAFMPFFFLGYCMRGKKLFIDAKYRKWCLLFLLATMTIPLFFSRYLGDLNQADPYGAPFRICSRLFVFGLSIPMSIAFMNLCPDTPWTAKQGKLSMQYYIYHAFIIYFFMIMVNRYSLPTSFLFVCLYSILIIALIGLLSYVPYFDRLTNPSSILKDKQKAITS